MDNYLCRAGLRVDERLVGFVEEEVLPGLSQSVDQVWLALERLLDEFTPRNTSLLNVRKLMQHELDGWYAQANARHLDLDAHEQFLKSINYIIDEGEDFRIKTEGVDPEIAKLAGPQLVVPVSNARFALNAVNARFGSFYDALYGSDVIDEPLPADAPYCHERGSKVVSRAKQFLDQYFTLRRGSHECAQSYFIDSEGLAVVLDDGSVDRLVNLDKFIGYVGDQMNPSSVVLENNGLHVFVDIDKKSEIGKIDSAGVKDIILESALTAIQDFEDSVVAVDAEDKVLVYRNWLGLMQGCLEASFRKGDTEFVRKIVKDRVINGKDGLPKTVRTRSLLLCRNVGHLMTNPMILLANGDEAYEGIVDAFISVLIAKHDLLRNTSEANSRTRSIYIVKPKMHGPDEVTFSNDLFARVEEALSLPLFTVKLGIMDEERRTSVNLKECIRRVRHRVVFINTGFLDRTGDEIHSSRRLGPFQEKPQIKFRDWYAAYENRNVQTGLETGFSGRAQIGKGMWPKPDAMREMVGEKYQQLNEGATTAWVPSPTAATLHALHYHMIDVYSNHEPSVQVSSRLKLLKIPIIDNDYQLSSEAVKKELDNNIQSILGYVVRWVDQGIGCSKVPDIEHVSLMEDRATLRISSQHVSNWLYHGLVSQAQVREAFVRIAVIVDEQNSVDPNYTKMSTNLDASFAFQAAIQLVFEGERQPNGYTEPILHMFRSKVKQALKTPKRQLA